MKRDRLLQHQLARLDRLYKRLEQRGCFELSGGKVNQQRFGGVVAAAICRSLKRFATVL